VQLLGWGDATHNKIRDTRPLLEQAFVDKIVAACLARLGEVAFSDAYEAGKGMTLEEAVAYSLGLVGTPAFQSRIRESRCDDDFWKSLLGGDSRKH